MNPLLQSILKEFLPPTSSMRVLKHDPHGLAFYNKVLGSYPDIKPASAAELGLLNMTPEVENALQSWLVTNGLYQVPTLELVEFLRDRIAGRSALEICAGHGWLGEALGVHSIDGQVFKHPALQIRGALLGGSQTCEPRPRVEYLMAEDAIEKYKPQVVFGCYATHKWDEETKTGSDLGVDDFRILNYPFVETYILVGCDSVHGPRPLIRENKHEKIRAPWIFSRGKGPAIWIWG